jgi:hypothetical protein
MDESPHLTRERNHRFLSGHAFSMVPNAAPNANLLAFPSLNSYNRIVNGPAAKNAGSLHEEEMSSDD